MSPDIADEPTAAPIRPRSVDLGIYAIFVHCAFSVAGALLTLPYHDEFVRRLHEQYPKNSTADIHRAAASGPAIFFALVLAVIYIVLAKFIRDGKNWARWIYAAMAVVLFQDVFRITSVFSKLYPFAMGLAVSLSALASIASLALLFLRTSNPYFRKPGVQRMSLGAMLRPRTSATAAARERAAGGVRRTGTGAADGGGAGGGPGGSGGSGGSEPTVNLQKGTDRTAPAGTTPPVDPRRPRAKSRKSAEQ
ncbi:hypothetical protein M6D93_18935 [Jatrophihabitans telluris]|uniref:DUF2127 domain-containing protein n=1 Tax=Jatrophihabitans telluris TaxID=2038343 RepID=A0ABY4QY50_9ACTN|nr:hypothetical protein [Jatrophihabitans telluris]UQX88334.1 hypothetical protein M6D93_18935 [Jatrophihabitans telluris]